MDELFFSTFYLKKKEEQLFCSLPTTAYIQYKNFRINLLTGERKEASVDYFLREMDHYRLDQNYESPIVIHLFYELGHFVNELYDHGETIVQHTCNVETGETPQSLADKVFQLECTAYVEAINKVASNLKV